MRTVLRETSLFHSLLQINSLQYHIYIFPLNWRFISKGLLLFKNTAMALTREAFYSYRSPRLPHHSLQKTTKKDVNIQAVSPPTREHNTTTMNQHTKQRTTLHQDLKKNIVQKRDDASSSILYRESKQLSLQEYRIPPFEFFLSNSFSLEMKSNSEPKHFRNRFTLDGSSMQDLPTAIISVKQRHRRFRNLAFASQQFQDILTDVFAVL